MDVSRLLRENVRAMQSYASARDDRADPDAAAETYLDANENPFDNGVNRYPDPHQDKLRDRLSEIKGVAPSNILLGNGSDEVLDLIYRAFCEPSRDNIISSPPTYGMYGVLCAVNRVENKLAPLDKDFKLNYEAIQAQINANTRIILVCSPNNPSGNSLDDALIEKLLRSTCLVVIDEAYIDFAHKASWTKRLAEFPNLIVCQTLSKAWGMAGIRLGICCASRYIIGVLNKIKPPYNINRLTQDKALELLRDEEQFRANLQLILSERARLKRAFSELPLIRDVLPSDANFFLVRFNDSKGVFDYLIDKGIIVRDRSKELHCEGCLRITVGTPRENDKLLEALKAYNG